MQQGCCVAVVLLLSRCVAVLQVCVAVLQEFVAVCACLLALVPILRDKFSVIKLADGILLHRKKIKRRSPPN
jgi:hypothetical protein